MGTSALVHSFGNLPAAINTTPHITRVNSSVFLCVLCDSVPCCPVTTYCVKFDTQQKLLLSKWVLLLSSMVVCLVLCPGPAKIHIFLNHWRESESLKSLWEQTLQQEYWQNNCWKGDQRGQVTAVFYLNC